MGYIFLSGVHGVGKTTLLERIEKDEMIIHTSVSNLIRKAGKRIDSRNKKTKNISQNQNLWKKELVNLHQVNGCPLILDGHFCLLDSESKIVILPKNTFEGTDMTKIILKKEDPRIIKERIEKRDKQYWNIEFIEKFQNLEEQQSIYFSKMNKIPLFVYESDNQYVDLLRYIRE